MTKKKTIPPPKKVEDMKQFFFDQDDSSHWYMIPTERRAEWEKARDMNLDTDDGYDEWCKGGWDDYRTGGGISDIDFYIP